MKKMKFAVICAAVTAMMGFTSCLDGDTNNVSTGLEFVRNTGMAGYYRFENSAGFVLEPNNQSQWAETSISSNYALIQYQYSPDSVKQNSNRLPITLQGLASVKDASYQIPGAEDTWANAPLYQVGMVAFPYFDENNLFLGVQYYAKADEDGSMADVEKSQHSFALYCSRTEDAIQGHNLVLYVQHQVTDLTINSERKSSVGFDYVHFYLTEAISWYKSQKSDLPENLVIKYKVPTTASGDDMLDYEKAVDASSSITLPYKSYFAETN